MRLFSIWLSVSLFAGSSQAGELLAGVGKVDITRPGEDAGSNPPWVKALVLSKGETHAVIVTLDAVAIAEIGTIRDPFLANVREGLRAKFGIEPGSVIVNASHCHAVIADDVEERTVRAVEAAWSNRVPVKTGVGTGHEDSVSRRAQSTIFWFR